MQCLYEAGLEEAYIKDTVHNRYRLSAFHKRHWALPRLLKGRRGSKFAGSQVNP